jgi:hypothetical protein
MRVEFPFTQKAVFRSRGGRGRYIVHELTPPLAGAIPLPEGVDPHGWPARDAGK